MKLKNVTTNEIEELIGLLTEIKYQVNFRYSHVKHLIKPSFIENITKDIKDCNDEIDSRDDFEQIKAEMISSKLKQRLFENI